MAKIEKQELILTPLSANAVKLAQSLYSTYMLSDQEISMSIPWHKLYHLFGLNDESGSQKRIFSIFEELNEPIMVHDFMYRGKKYPQMVLTFCDYEKIQEGEISCLQIEINEIYLEVLKNYMLHPFLEIKH